MGRKEPDIFDIVKRRKQDIKRRQLTVDIRNAKKKRNDNLLVKKMLDPICREEEIIRRRDVKSPGCPNSRRKVLAEREKMGIPLGLEENSEYNKQRSFNLNRKRQFVVAMTNPKYHCPRCGECKTKMAEWFVSNHKDNRKKKVMCRSCVLSFGWEINSMPKTQEMLNDNIKLYTSIIRYYKIDATDLCRKRVRAGFSVKQFAELVGWTADYQYKLENGRVLKLNESAMDDLVAAFKRIGTYITRSIWGEAMKRYLIDGKLIKELRISLGISTSRFTNKTGWSSAYQRRIENAKGITISKSMMDMMNSILIANKSV